MKRVSEGFRGYLGVSEFLRVYSASGSRLRVEELPEGRWGRAAVLLPAAAPGRLHAARVPDLQHGAHTRWRRVQVYNGSHYDQLDQLSQQEITAEIQAGW